MKIVVGYDGSPAAKRALERAAAFAAAESQIVLVAAMEAYPRSGVTIPANFDAVEAEQRAKDLDEARRLLSSSSAALVTIQEWGAPAEVLIKASHDADLLTTPARQARQR